MATTSRKALRGHTVHTPSGFLVFNEGKTTKDIPTELIGRLEAEGVIEKASTSSSSTKSSSSSRSRTTARRKAPAGAANKSGTTATGAAVTKTDAGNAGAGTADAPTE